MKLKAYLISSSEISDIVYRKGNGLGYCVEPYLKRRAMQAIRKSCDNKTQDELPSAADFVAYITGNRVEGTSSGDSVRRFAQLTFWYMYQKEVSKHCLNICLDTVLRVDNRFVNYISRMYLYMQKLIPRCY